MLLFNLFGTLIGLVLFLICDNLIHLEILNEAITPFAVAGFHSIFNILTTVILLPFSGKLVKIAKKVVKEDTVSEVFLDERLLLSPKLAVEECRKKTIIVMERACDGISSAFSLLDKYDDKIREDIERMEEDVDDMVGNCNNFLISLSSKNITNTAAVEVADMLHGLGDMERISDYSVSLAKAIKKIKSRAPKFGSKEYDIMKSSVTGILAELKECYINKDSEGAASVNLKAYTLVRDIKKIRKKGIKGLKGRQEDAELSVYMTEYLTSCRRVVEHAINISEYLVDKNTAI